MSIKDKILLYAEYKKLSKREVEIRCGLSNSALNNSVKINSEAVALFLNASPDLSAEWLMRGEGEMIKSSHPSNVNNFDLSDHHNNYANGANSTAQSSNENKELIELLKQQNEAQTAQIATLTKLVETLANK